MALYLVKAKGWGEEYVETNGGIAVAAGMFMDGVRRMWEEGEEESDSGPFNSDDIEITDVRIVTWRDVLR